MGTAHRPDDSARRQSFIAQRARGAPWLSSYRSGASAAATSLATVVGTEIERAGRWQLAF